MEDELSSHKDHSDKDEKGHKDRGEPYDQKEDERLSRPSPHGMEPEKDDKGDEGDASEFQYRASQDPVPTKFIGQTLDLAGRDVSIASDDDSSTVPRKQKEDLDDRPLCLPNVFHFSSECEEVIPHHGGECCIDDVANDPVRFGKVDEPLECQEGEGGALWGHHLARTALSFAFGVAKSFAVVKVYG